MYFLVWLGQVTSEKNGNDLRFWSWVPPHKTVSIFFSHLTASLKPFQQNLTEKTILNGNIFKMNNSRQDISKRENSRQIKVETILDKTDNSG